MRRRLPIESSRTMLRFICPKCQEILEAEPQRAGQQMRCTSCGQALSIPALAPPVAGAAPQAGAGAAPRAAGRPASPPTPAVGPTPLTTTQLTCSGCGQWLDINEDQFGKLIRCPGCGLMMRTPLPARSLVGASGEVSS